MSTDQLNLILAIGAGIAVGFIVLAALIAAVALWQLSRDVRRVSRTAAEALAIFNTELPATLKELRQAATNISRVSAELQPRVERVDALLDEADGSVASLRATIEAAEDIVRGPAAAIDRAKRMVGAAGQGIATGTARLRRQVRDRR